MASTYETLDVEQLIQIGVDEEHKEAVPTCSSTNGDHLMQWTDKCIKSWIALYQVHKPKFADVNFKNKSVWETIAAEIKERATTQQLYNVPTSGSSLKKSFVEVEDSKRATGRGKKTCKF